MHDFIDLNLNIGIHMECYDPLSEVEAMWKNEAVTIPNIAEHGKDSGSNSNVPEMGTASGMLHCTP